MNLIQMSVKQPITVAVGVILSVMAGLIAFSRVPIQMTPEVQSVVISVSTFWENASAQEIESDVIEEQEKRLGDLAGLVSMTSTSQPGSGQIRLEFQTGTNIDEAMSEVDQKLSEVPGYPAGVDQPQIEDFDPESVDYISWIGLASTDPNFDATTLYDFMERRLRPRFERIKGVSQVGIRGAREMEVQVRVNPTALAQRGITYSELVHALEMNNGNYSGGKLPDGKSDIRVRMVGRFRDPGWVESLVIRREASGPIYLRDVAEVVETHKEMTEWVRARGQRMPFFNFMLESGGNLLETMGAINDEVARLNAPGGVLEQEAKELGVNGTFELVPTYDASTYVVDAIDLVQSNIIVGGLLAVMTLLLFLRSLRTIGVIAIAIPISTVVAVVVMVMLGRTMNIISLAGMAFAVGMVVDNAIVVIENIFRHLEMGKPPKQAAMEGTQEVATAVLASTLTTIVVFFPILLIEEQAGQLFRDIAIAIMAAVGVSYIVSITVIPAAAGQWLSAKRPAKEQSPAVAEANDKAKKKNGFVAFLQMATDLPAIVGGIVYGLTGSWFSRLAVIGVFAVVTVVGTWLLIPPLDYLPVGNRNIVFGLLIPPPGYNVDQLSELGERMEEVIKPAWEAAGDKFGAEAVVRGSEWNGEDNRVAHPLYGTGEMVTPPPLDHYFLVAWDGRVFQAGISKDKKRVVDALPLMNAAAAGANAPDVINFAFQMPLFRVGGTTGSAIKIDLVGDDLDKVANSAGALFGALAQQYGPMSVTPEPANFSLPTPELRVTPNTERLQDVGMEQSDLGLAVAANGDGIMLVRAFDVGGELKDLKIVTQDALLGDPIYALHNSPIATPEGRVVDLQSLAKVERVEAADQIKHSDRQRAVTLQFTPPTGVPLQAAIEQVDQIVAGMRESGAIPQNVAVNMAGSAGQLAQIRTALMGDGTLIGTLSSSLFLALLIVYLLMVVLFQSWSYPLVIMVSVPLALLGGFAGLALVHHWSVVDRYMPIQNMDVLTILGFVILAGVVVNNAILIVYQTINILNGRSEEGEDTSHYTPREAIAKSVESRVRPILMSTLTSVGGMLPLVLMPGSGSELYRGLGAVVVGGLVVSTIFTMVLVPILLSVLFDLSPPKKEDEAVAI
ncbi:efflux RND transporter permease subunit [Blastopirellula sp. JC732]|uniref:Efflux RND transporter permease subunit n=1 Tax=Blastopirellula sediminis TaxID=2894196 RepID=A0A9X1SHL9_9BACT|nr:efflux RND transporter permease subunit [Blastopirellula sediminis]MCC9607908.1 efflux RND transporter permease subunit [Blastopirellula sediminis]MCC9627299.1 efflux RND transporter permease subunit [Blastopirellula sediminis]